ncbi:DUF4347 domain-containing protein, partial [Litorimonas cladophorae]|uniref:DUF4347 domain-containing protein n=1 Tax=Litorimonas cladophorae TaxID=1220491 RepID=UPI001673EE4F
MSEKTKNPITNKLKNSTSRLGLRALEPRILLDAAGFVTGADVAMDAMDTQNVAEDMAILFNTEATPLAPRGEVSQVNALLSALSEAEADYQSSTNTIGDNAAEVLDIDWVEPPVNGAGLVFIDQSVEGWESLAAEIPDGYETIFIPADADGLEVITTTLANRNDVAAIHILSHGQSDQLTLGTSIITAETLQGEHADDFAGIASSLTESADILIYGCDFGQNSDALSLMADLTGADIAASTNDTGSADLGGNWDLEASDGEIDSDVLTLDNWNYLLDRTVLNQSGGMAADGSDGLLIYVASNGQLQVVFRGETQLYHPLATDDSAHLFNGVYLAVDNTVVGGFTDSALTGPYSGPANGPGIASTDVTFIESGQTVTGSGTGSDPYIVTTTMFYDAGGLSGIYDAATDFEVVITTTYSAPNPYFTQSVTITPPSTNTAPIKFYHTIDTYLNINVPAGLNPDAGPGFTLDQSVGNPSVVGVARDADGDGTIDAFTAFAEQQGGEEFDQYYSAAYDGSNLYGGLPGVGINDGGDIQNTIDVNPNTDNGLGIQFNLDDPGVAQTFTYHIAFRGEATIDLDADDSSGALGTGYNSTYAIGSGATIAVVDSDVTIRNVVGDISAVRISLTDAQIGDSLTVNTTDLPVNVSVQSQTSTEIVLVATGGFALPESTFDLALQEVGFTTTSTMELARVISFGVTNEMGEEGFASSGTITVGYDTDGDGVLDVTDRDDDNDGILDSAEMGALVSGGITWNHNGGSPAGTSFAGGIDASAQGFISTAQNISFGSGLTTTGSDYEHVLLDASADTYQEARDQNDYVEVSFTLSEAATLNSIQHGLVPTGWGGSQAGNYNVTAEISSDGFATSSILYQDGYQPQPNGGYETSFENVDTVLAAGSYTVRFYVYNEQNNASLANGTVLPDNTIAFDDLTLNFSARMPIDTDLDGIADHLDIDSDNDGITDNIEAQTTAGYIAPSGVGSTPDFADANADGLDDNYGPNGLSPVNTDNTDNPDFRDTNSDNEGANDTVEAGLTGTATGLSTALNDADGDGLFDVFDTQNGTTSSDGYVVNEGIATGAASYPDIDTDASAGVPLTADVDFRDSVLNNRAPIAQNDSFTTSEDGVLSVISLLTDNGNGADSDADNDSLTISAVEGVAANVGNQITLSSGALLTVNANGSFEYDPNGAFDYLDTGESAQETFTYSISDGNGGSDTATVTLTLTGTNDSPIIDLNGALPGTDYDAVFVEDTPGAPLANLLTFDAVIDDPEDNIGQIQIEINLPANNDGSDEVFRIDEGDLQLTVDLSTGEITAPNPLVYGETTFAVSYETGVLTIENANSQIGVMNSDDLQGFMRLLAYQNASQNNSEGNRSFAFNVIDPVGVTIATTTMTVERSNDAPVPTTSTSSNGTVTTVGSGSPTPFATVVAGEPTIITVAELLAQLDTVDAEGNDLGIGIIYADETEGVWQYRRPDITDNPDTSEVETDFEHQWTNFQLGDPENSDSNPVPDGEALLMDPDAILRFVPNPGFSNDAEIRFRVWDGTVGTASNPPSSVSDDSGGSGSGNTSSLSTAAFTASLAADTDGDGVINSDDIDDDNDGILDVNEGYIETNSQTGVWVLSGQTATYDFGNGISVRAETNSTSVSGTTFLGNFSNNVLNPGGEAAGQEFWDPSNLANDASLSGVFSFGSELTFEFYDTVTGDPVVVLNPVIHMDRIGGAAIVQLTPTTQGNEHNSALITLTGGLTWAELSGTTDFGTTATTAVDSSNGTTGTQASESNWGADQTAAGSLEIQGAASSFTLTFDAANSNDSSNTLGDGIEFLIQMPIVIRDTDGDGIADHLDIDSDDDGITDNVEAQTTAGYIAPSGTGALMGDFDGDGLDDVYDATPTGSSNGAGSVGLLPVDTDGLGTADVLDPDSDDDGIADIDEAGHGATYAAGDTDGDGLADVFEGSNVNDGFDVNDENLDSSNTNFNLAGVPALDADGSNAIPLVRDLYFRDVNDVPVVATAIPDTSAIDGQTVSITADITDADGDSLTYSAINLPAGLNINPATGEIFGMIDNSASQGGTAGVYAITVTAIDGNGGTVSDTFNLSVTNPAPTAVDDALTTSEDTALTTNVITGSDSDPDGDSLFVSLVDGTVGNVGNSVAGANGGLFTIDANGDLNFDPNGDFEGLDVGETATTTLTYQVSDGEGGTDTATVTVTIQGANDTPIVTGTLAAQMGSDGTAQVPFDASTVFSDVDGESLSYTATNLPSWMSINPATGVITGTPPADASQGGAAGVYTISVIATDPDGTSVSTPVTYSFTNPIPVVDAAIGDQSAVDNE